MGLLRPLRDGTLTQVFGPSAYDIQPSMWYRQRHKAFWQWFPGATFARNVHAGVDFAGKPAGTGLQAAEDGVVTKSFYDAINGGGNVVEVEIRPGVRYSYNHCQSRRVGVGQVVRKGQTIATVGATGTILINGVYYRSAYGVHCHTVLLRHEKGTDGVWRWMVYNFAEYMVGGVHAGAAWIQPKAQTYPTVEVKPDVNIRSTPDLDAGDANIAYLSKPDGIYTRNGTKVAPAGADFELRGHWSNDDGGWGRLYKFNQTLWVKDGLYG